MCRKGEGWRPSAATLIMLAPPHRTCKKLSVGPRAAVVIAVATTRSTVRDVVVEVYTVEMQNQHRGGRCNCGA